MARENQRKRDERRFGKAERLADLIGENECGSPFWLKDADDVHLQAWVDGVEDFRTDVAQAVQFEASNVAEFAFSHGFRKEWNIVDDVPCWLPPFPELFLEYRLPPAAKDQDMGVFSENVPHALGHLISTRESNAEDCASWFPESGKRDRVRFLVSVASAVRFSAEAVATVPIIQRRFGFDGQGRMVAGRTDFPLTCCIDHDSKEWKDALYYISGYMECFSIPMILALGFLHCKNVVQTIAEPDRDLNRARRKAGLKPFVRYRTINIEPMKQVLRTEGGIETNGLRKALHIARGHFATYTADRPLFGRFVGTVWRPAHTRGTLKQGVVVSDYHVQAPRPQPTEESS